MTLLYQIELRNDTAANWTSANPTLAAGEAGFENNTGLLKIGNGSSLWNALPYVTSNPVGLSANGSLASPNLITASIGITGNVTNRTLYFLAGNGGAVTVTAAAAITAGATFGQELILQGTSDTNTVTLNNGSGLSLNGPVVIGASGAGARIYLVWDGANWSEVSRR